eukprot:TRINITY_DN10354_c0_g2_i2.p1 TRINITY_DN10354_c0_g2~~TRINITY_DN10354_c0_g2_i2.p1  ORF type:complete len:1477 (-),score=183.38 TRINITY_DN10354_c0_g2_i2:158-3985(-)
MRLMAKAVPYGFRGAPKRNHEDVMSNNAWRKAVFSIAFAKYPELIDGKQLYFDTIFWDIYDGGDSPFGLVSRLPYIKQNEATMLSRGDRVHPNEIRQGNLGICFLLASIQTMGKFGLLVDPGDSPTAVYKVTVADNVERTWRPMYIDDRYPATNSYDIAMSGSSDFRERANTQVISLIIKAMSKYAGGLQNLIDGGTQSSGLAILLGANTRIVTDAYEAGSADDWDVEPRWYACLRNKGAIQGWAPPPTHWYDDLKDLNDELAPLTFDKAGDLNAQLTGENGLEAWYSYFHKRMMFRGGSGDVFWNDKSAWTAGFTWTELSAISISFFGTISKFDDATKTIQAKFNFVGNHAYSVFAVEKLQFSGCPTIDDASGDGARNFEQVSSGTRTIHAIQVRNPWKGGENVNGLLGSKDPRWGCTTIKRERWGDDAGGTKSWVDLQDDSASKTNGVFWLPLRDAMIFTDSMEISEVPPRNAIKFGVEPVGEEEMDRIAGIGDCAVAEQFTREGSAGPGFGAATFVRAPVVPDSYTVNQDVAAAANYKSLGGEALAAAPTEVPGVWLCQPVSKCFASKSRLRYQQPWSMQGSYRFCTAETSPKPSALCKDPAPTPFQMSDKTVFARRRRTMSSAAMETATCDSTFGSAVAIVAKSTLPIFKLREKCPTLAQLKYEKTITTVDAAGKQVETQETRHKCPSSCSSRTSELRQSANAKLRLENECHNGRTESCCCLMQDCFVARGAWRVGEDPCNLPLQPLHSYWECTDGVKSIEPIDIGFFLWAVPYGPDVTCMAVCKPEDKGIKYDTPAGNIAVSHRCDEGGKQLEFSVLKWDDTIDKRWDSYPRKYMHQYCQAKQECVLPSLPDPNSYYDVTSCTIRDGTFIPHGQHCKVLCKKGYAHAEGGYTTRTAQCNTLDQNGWPSFKPNFIFGMEPITWKGSNYTLKPKCLAIKDKDSAGGWLVNPPGDISTYPDPKAKCKEFRDKKIDKIPSLGNLSDLDGYVCEAHCLKSPAMAGDSAEYRGTLAGQTWKDGSKRDQALGMCQALQNPSGCSTIGSHFGFCQSFLACCCAKYACFKENGDFQDVQDTAIRVTPPKPTPPPTPAPTPSPPPEKTVQAACKVAPKPDLNAKYKGAGALKFKMKNSDATSLDKSVFKSGLARSVGISTNDVTIKEILINNKTQRRRLQSADDATVEVKWESDSKIAVTSESIDQGVFAAEVVVAAKLAGKDVSPPSDVILEVTSTSEPLPGVGGGGGGGADLISGARGLLTASLGVFMLLSSIPAAVL